MKDMFCTSCHDFRGGGLHPDQKICVACHQVREAPSPGSRVLAHQQFDCMTCHHTHDPERPAGQACERCHFLTMKRGEHPAHLEVLDNDCLTCHKPHQWKISQKQTGELCSMCHDAYPLEKFR
ncbi:hypothetical protein UZ36_04470 [Candidatus Nitromaritima sp. SCGC AAA799-C22]|nr:hypothetical protein UZ36_04470 [Candidatus Nitromaritima sp. SCGC AAA799-C22]